MLNVKYNLTTCSSYLNDMAAGFNAVSSQKVTVKNNRLVFPESIGKGTLACYDVDTGLGVVILDCVFSEDVNFIRLPAEINYFHAMSFNLSAFSFMVNKDGEEKLVKGESWQKKILYSTSETGLTWVAPANTPIKMVVLLLTREWVINKYQLKGEQNQIPYQKELLEDAPLQFTLDLDLEIVLLAQEIITSEPPAFLVKLFYKGYAKRLIALALEKQAGHSQPGTVLKYQNVVRIIEARKKIEEHLELPLPKLEELAKSCNMSLSKFAALFKAMYAKSYLQFFQDLRMDKAAQLLKKNWEIVDAARSVGFINQSHFTRVFKEYFRVSPKTYRNVVKRH
ncbi:helix-turn-helix transcriptional regulator [Flavobacterium chilense]|uniref:AraC-type DNA-binding protein n=1 Tax=Flavobacterium chilense TaxID=946677 RepID=A0A1M7DX87_9FLAO|nr:AraC family transcriptional regulator [Flavobacterium chilense]SHL83779.1 AraC-type DNA-binding protein [Flavobacterium chilense]